jgi:hypothetical protein
MPAPKNLVCLKCKQIFTTVGEVEDPYLCIHCKTIACLERIEALLDKTLQAFAKPKKAKQ